MLPYQETHFIKIYIINILMFEKEDKMTIYKRKQRSLTSFGGKQKRRCLTMTRRTRSWNGLYRQLTPKQRAYVKEVMILLLRHRL